MAVRSTSKTLITIVSVIMAVVTVINILVSVIFIFVGKAMDDRYKDAVEVTAVVKELVHKNDDVYVNYVFEDKVYTDVKLEGVLNGDKLSEGDTITVYVIPSSPRSATMFKFGVIFYIVAGIFGGIGILFLIIVIILNIITRRRNRMPVQKTYMNF